MIGQKVSFEEMKNYVGQVTQKYNPEQEGLEDKFRIVKRKIDDAV